MGLFSKSKHKEEKKTLENQKKLQPLGKYRSTLIHRIVIKYFI